MNKERIAQETFFFYFSKKRANSARNKRLLAGLVYKKRMCLLLNGKTVQYTRKGKKKTKGCIGEGVCIGPEPIYPKY